jgi:hypothetical protein
MAKARVGKPRLRATTTSGGRIVMVTRTSISLNKEYLRNGALEKRQ